MPCLFIIQRLAGKLRALLDTVARNVVPIVVLGAVTLVEMILNFARYFSDSGDYVQLALHGSALFGVEANIRFALPYLAGQILKAFPSPALVADRNFHAVFVIALLNCVFWAGAVVAAYMIGWKLMDKNGAFLTALCFTTSVPILSYGAAVLTDMSGYFFSGLALLFALASTKSRLWNIFRGLVLTAGPFFHFSATLGFLFASGYGLRRRSGFWSLVGVFPALLVGVYVALSKGWLFAWFDYTKNLFASQLSNLGAKFFGGPDFAGGSNLPGALSNTFAVSAPFGFQLQMLDSFASILGTTNAATYMWFALVLLVGMFKIPRKRLLALFFTVMSVFSFVLAGLFQDRWLFVIWPFFVPVLVLGIRTLARIPAAMMRTLLSKPGLSRAGVLLNPDFYAIVFFLIQAIGNTAYITYGFHLNPPQI
jgi:hypothetical protein